MKKMISKLVILSDGLDKLGLKKDADRLDAIISRATRNEDFDDLSNLFDQRVEMQDSEDDGPPSKIDRLPEDDEEVMLATEEDKPEARKKEPNRLDMLRKRHELLKLKRLLEEDEKEEEGEKHIEENPLPEMKLETSFEDEDEEDDENDADDSNNLKKTIDYLKEHPELLEKLLLLVE